VRRSANLDARAQGAAIPSGSGRAAPISGARRLAQTGAATMNRATRSIGMSTTQSTSQPAGVVVSTAIIAGANDCPLGTCNDQNNHTEGLARG
jgi:hypothetical protein